MTAPNIPTQFPFPSAGEQPITYPELLETLRCACPAGAVVMGSPSPAATINIGDVIAPISQHLSTFMSMYGVVTVILRMIACIIDVLCALINPFAVLAAIIRLFGTCLPDFLLIFPQFAIPSIIICIFKIIIAIIQYITTVIIPVIMDIINNVEMLTNAFKSSNKDAIAAVVFKIVALIKELFNIIGILSVLSALFVMVKALLAMGIGIPCGGGGGSCEGCAEDQCPTFIRDNTTVNGTDGQFSAIIYPTNPPTYLLQFSSPANTANFLNIQDFFPRGLDYSKFAKTKELPYYITSANTTYAAMSVDTSVENYGKLNLYRIPQTLKTDGYLSNQTGPIFLPTTLTDNYIRFGTKTSTFDSTYVGAYIELEDTRTTTNNGTWRVAEVYDAYNVRLDRGVGNKWQPDPMTPPSPYTTLNPTPFVHWYAIPFGGPRAFSFEINHTELLRYSMIGVGCHPAVRATIAGVRSRFPDASGTVLPDLPDFDKLVTDCNACIEQISPITVDSQYVLDNYNMIAANAPGAAICLTHILSTFQSGMSDYVRNIYPRVFSPENSQSQFTASPLVELVGNEITASVVPYDIYGAKLASTLPPGIIDVEILADAGEIGPTTEVLDAYGNSTGTFEAQITSPTALTANLTARIADKFVSYFDGYNLIPKTIEVKFVKPEVIGKRDEASPEPLGKGRGN